MPSRRVMIVAGAVVLLTLVAGGVWLRNARNRVQVSFTEGSLNTLEGKLNGIKIEDLGGLTSEGTAQPSSQDIDQLGQNIGSLEFDDLGGLTPP